MAVRQGADVLQGEVEGERAAQRFHGMNGVGVFERGFLPHAGAGAAHPHGAHPPACVVPVCFHQAVHDDPDAVHGRFFPLQQLRFREVFRFDARGDAGEFLPVEQFETGNRREFLRPVLQRALHERAQVRGLGSFPHEAAPLEELRGPLHADDRRGSRGIRQPVLPAQMQQNALHVRIEAGAPGVVCKEFYECFKRHPLHAQSQDRVCEGLRQGEGLRIVDVEGLARQARPGHERDNGAGGLVHIGDVAHVGQVRRRAEVHVGPYLLVEGVVVHVALERAGFRIAGDVARPVHADRESFRPQLFQRDFGQEFGAHVQVGGDLPHVHVELREQRLGAPWYVARAYGCRGHVMHGLGLPPAGEVRKVFDAGDVGPLEGLPVSVVAGQGRGMQDGVHLAFQGGAGLPVQTEPFRGQVSVQHGQAAGAVGGQVAAEAVEVVFRQAGAGSLVIPAAHDGRHARSGFAEQFAQKVDAQGSRAPGEQDMLQLPHGVGVQRRVRLARPVVGGLLRGEGPVLLRRRDQLFEAEQPGGPPDLRLLEIGGLIGDGGVGKEVGRRDVEGFTEVRQQGDGAQRIAADIVEGIEQAEALVPEHVFPGLRDAGFLGIARGQGARPGRRDLGAGQLAPVHFAVGIERHFIQLHHVGRHHVFGQRVPEHGLDPVRVQCGRRRAVGRQNLVAAWLLQGHHHAFQHALHILDARFDFARLHAVAAYLDLKVHAPDEIDGAVFQPFSLVAGAEHALPRQEGVVDEVPVREFRAIEVSAADLDARNTDFSGHADGARPPPGVENVDARVGHGRAHGGLGDEVPHIVAQAGHGGFAGAVFVGQAELAQPIGFEPVAAHHKVPERCHLAQAHELFGELGGEVGVGDAVGAKVGVEIPGGPAQVFRDDVQGRARHQRGEDLDHGHVETEGRKGGAAGFGRHPVVGGVPVDEIDHGAVFYEHSLGIARGAGSEDAVGEGVAAFGQSGVGVVGGKLAVQRDRGALEVQAAELVRAAHNAGGVGIFEDEGDAVRGVMGVQPDIGRAGFQGGQHARHGPGGAVRDHGHDAVPAPARRRDGAGRAVGKAIELAVGQGAVFRDHGDVVRTLLGVRLDGLANRFPVRSRGGPGVELIEEGGSLLRAEDVDVAHGEVRILGHGGQDGAQVAGHAGDGFAAVEGCPVVQFQHQAAVVFLGCDGDVELGGAGGQGADAGLEALQLEMVFRADVAHDEVDVEHGVASRPAVDAEMLVEIRDGVFAVLMDGQHLVPCLPQQFGKGLAVLGPDARGQGADEHSDNARGSGPVAAARAGAQAEVVAVGPPRGENADAGHEYLVQRGLAAPGQGAQRLREFVAQVLAVGRPLEVLMSGSGKVGGQFRFRRGLEQLPPEGFVPGPDFRFPGRLPRGHVLVLQGQRVEALPAIQGEKLAQVDAHGDAVEGDVVEVEQEPLAAVGMGHQPDLHERRAGQVEGAREAGGEVGRAVAAGLAEVELEVGLVVHALHAPAVSYLEGRAQGFVPVQQGLQGVREPLVVEPAFKGDAQGHVVRDSYALHAAEQVELLLRDRGGVGLRGRGRNDGVGLRFPAVQMCRQEPGGGAFEDGGQFHVAAEIAAQGELQGHGAQGVASALEEVCVHAHVLFVQHRRPGRAEPGFQFGLRGPVLLPGLGGGMGLRQLPAVDLAAGVDGHGLQPDHVRRNHEGRDPAVQARRDGGGGGVAAEIAAQVDVPGPVLEIADGRLRHAVHGKHRVFDFAQFDAEAAQLDLPVHASEVQDVAFRRPAGQVSGPVHGFARMERVRNKAFQGLVLPLVVSPRHPRAADAQLSAVSRRLRMAETVENVHAEVGQGPADGNVVLKARDRMPRGVDGTLRGAVHVDQAVGSRGEDAHLLAPDGQRAQGRVVHEIHELFAELGGQKRPGDAVVLVVFVQVAQGEADLFRDDVQLRAAHEGAEYLHQACVEGEAGMLGQPVVRRQALVADGGVDGVADGPVLQGHPFGQAGGAGRVDDHAQVVGGVAVVEGGVVGMEDGGVVQVHDQGVAEILFRHEPGLGQDERGGDVPKHELDARIGVLRVYGHEGAAAFEDRELGDYDLGRAFGQQAHHLAGTGPVGPERPGHGVGLPVQLVVAESFPPVHDSGVAGKAAGDVGNAAVQGRVEFPVGRCFIEVADKPVSLRGGQKGEVPDGGVGPRDAGHDGMLDVAGEVLHAPPLEHLLVVQKIEADGGVACLRPVRVGQEPGQRDERFPVVVDHGLGVGAVGGPHHFHQGAGDEVGRLPEAAAQIGGQPVVGEALVGENVAHVLAGGADGIREGHVAIHVELHGRRAHEHAHGFGQFGGKSVGGGRADDQVAAAQGPRQHNGHGRQNHAEGRNLVLGAVGDESARISGREPMRAGQGSDGCGGRLAGDVHGIGHGVEHGVPVCPVLRVLIGLQVALFGVMGRLERRRLRKVDGLPRAQRLVGGNDALEDQVARTAVRQDVMVVGEQVGGPVSDIGDAQSVGQGVEHGQLLPRLLPGPVQIGLFPLSGKVEDFDFGLEVRNQSFVRPAFMHAEDHVQTGSLADDDAQRLMQSFQVNKRYP